MSDAELIARFDGLDARLERIDDRLEQTDARLLRMVDALETQAKALLALDAHMETGFAALNGRVSRLSEMLTRGFTWRDEQMQEILARLEQLEEKVQR